MGGAGGQASPPSEGAQSLLTAILQLHAFLQGAASAPPTLPLKHPLPAQIQGEFSSQDFRLCSSYRRLKWGLID